MVPGWFAGEFIGTFLLVFFGCGSVATSLLTGAQVGIFQVAIVWGIAIAGAIYLTGSLSGAHLNPAVTIAFAAWADFSWKKVPQYLGTQLLGAFTASLALYAIYHRLIAQYEAAHGIVRGAAGSEATAMIFGEYFPNPAGLPLTRAARSLMPVPAAFLVELVGTAILILVIFGCADRENSSGPKLLAAPTIGLTVTILISLFGPLTMAGLNPARDIAPRLFSYFAGWRGIVFSANGAGWYSVYLLAPLLGGLLGGGIYRLCLRPNYFVEPAAAASADKI